MPISAVTIDERTRDDASDSRVLEWEANVTEFLRKAQERFNDAVQTLHITLNEQEIFMEALGANDAPISTHSITHDLLADQIEEYVDIVRQIETSDGLNRVEALDMAKKVTHDRAGRVLKRHLRDLGMTHEAARRLFTLLLSIKLDTTKLAGIYGHRRIR